MKTVTMTRREALALAGAGIVTAATFGILPSDVEAKPADVEAAMKKLIGDKKPKSGRIKMDMPQIAENGSTVPMSIEVDSPMTKDDYVKSLHVFAELNPRPDVASFHFTPQSGVAFVSTRMRMSKTQNIVA
ncbi:MAG: thiosulfate oxidation carrier protein SoxY, partial [Boseongicola sp.]|nr:thiosulfate oxidation carrier protein SoxY [Boseongicola sp.]